MSSNDTPTGHAVSLGKIHHVELRDLQSLLRRSIGEEVLVVDYKTASLLPVGENYGSSMLKVDATIKRTKESAEEQLHLVAKMLPSSELQRSFLNATASFTKEIFVFEKLIDSYRKIEEESGVSPDKLLAVLPKFYGSRLSLKENSSEADDDAVLLMENLKPSGYSCMNRLNGLDLDHARLAMSELARFHALGVALRRKEAALFAEAKELLKAFPFGSDEEMFEALMRQMLDNICVDPRIAKYADRVREKATVKLDYLQRYEAPEQWESIIHGDFWVNNIMFHGENGKIDDIKFVDFQITQASSTLKDLPYFLCGSLSMECIDKHFEDLLDVYHANFVQVLEKTGCDTSFYTRRNFYEQLKKDAPDELLHCLMALKVFTQEVPADFDLNELDTQIFSSKASNLYLDRAWKVVSKFVEMEWI